MNDDIKVYIGTSGWMYSWNKGKSLDWYVKKSGLNSVELNMSFYRYPKENQVEKWSKYKIVWAIKVNQIITHRQMLSKIDTFLNFQKLFEKLNPRFYLFQMPPSFQYNEENIEKIRKFEKILGDKMAIEFRNEEWYKNLPDFKCTVVSIDSPIGNFYVNSNGYVYLRMHGRREWYFYEYSNKELEEVKDKILNLNPKEIYIFFNNDLWMLENALYMKRLLEKFFVSL